jgi:hypothetical protein
MTMNEWDEEYPETPEEAFEPSGIAAVNVSFERWLEAHKSPLSRLRLPVVEDYILVVAFRDLDTDLEGGFATLKTQGSPTYRIRGLLEVGLDFYSAAPFQNPTAG